MKSVWKIPDSVSDLNPPTFTSSEPPPPLPIPPDPPDPNSTLFPVQFPPLSSAPLTGSKSSRRIGPQTPPLIFTAVRDVQQANSASRALPASTSPCQIESAGTLSVRSETTTVHETSTVLETVAETNLPKQTEPFKATQPPQSLSPPINSIPPKPLLATPPAPLPSPSPPAVTNGSHQSSQVPSLVERIRLSEDKSLQRLAPISVTASGRPRVRISDEVFQIGANLHKDFIVCYYNGKAPPLQPDTKCTYSYVGKREEA